LERTEQNEQHGPQISYNLDIIIRSKRGTKDICSVLILQGCRTTNIMTLIGNQFLNYHLFAQKIPNYSGYNTESVI